MDPVRLRALLQELQQGDVSLEDTIDALRKLPFRRLDSATIDHQRALRQGVPEVIFGEGKTPEQLVAIGRAIVDAGQNLLATRLDPAKAAALVEAVPGATYHEAARVVRLDKNPPPPRPGAPIGVVCAGTSDLPVCEEAVQTLGALGFEVTKIVDVGVAGIHRLFGRLDEMMELRAIIVCAGMEGALSSVVGGLVPCPVIAVPTSVGYGVAMGGLTAMLGMLTACSSGITVVNIDNGFGAAMAVHRMFPSPRAS